MALTSGSKILVSDISTALGGKIDTAGAGLSKDGTSLALASLHSASGTAGPTANATPAYGATFTVPQINYDTYGRVTEHSNYTVQIPAAPSVTSAKNMIGTPTASKSGNILYIKMPSGATWSGYFSVSYVDGDNVGASYSGWVFKQSRRLVC